MTNPCSSCTIRLNEREARKKKKEFPKNCYRKVSNPCQKLLLANKSFIDPHERKKNGYDLFFRLLFCQRFSSECGGKKKCNICTYGTLFSSCCCCCCCNRRCSIGWFFFYHLLSDKLGIHRLLKDFSLLFDELKLNGGKWRCFIFFIFLRTKFVFFSFFLKKDISK